ncbi:MAG: heat-inducible transcription repressor HrcA [Candidatus Kapabacteria bacterium]|nr:heat-inducible transcription repressor HrcA [Candidatus Kapabacteria bacterium]
MIAPGQYLSTPQRDLSERERTILQAVVHLYILGGMPVGSRVLSSFLSRTMPLSPATIRNTMADLEMMGYITHPHTSAGRLPTDLGYRFYVDSLIESQPLPFPAELQSADAAVADLLNTPRESVVKDATRILGSLSRHLAIVQLPTVRQARVRRVEIVALSSERFVVIIDLDSELVRTVSLETRTAVELESIQEIGRYLNERLHGRPLADVTELLSEGASPHAIESSLLRLFVDQIGSIDVTNDGSTVHVSGATNLIAQPHHDSPERLRTIIELIENEDVIVHLLGSSSGTEGITVRIGNEMPNVELRDYSLVTSTYRAGTARGTLGVIGPRRMDYGRMINIVQLMSGVLSRTFGQHTP